MESRMGSDFAAGTSPYGGSTGDGSELKDKAAALGQTARSRMAQTLDGQKGELSSLLEKVAENIQDDRFGAYAADYVRRGAEFLKGRSTDDILSSVMTQARTRPSLLVGASFLAGFAIARLARR
jgi:hypothetical protein